MPWRLALEGGDGAGLGKEGAEVRAAADDGVRGQPAEVALERGAALADEVVALHDLALDEALVGAGGHEEAAVGRGEAVGEGDDVAEAAAHADLVGAVGEARGDEVGEVAP